MLSSSVTRLSKQLASSQISSALSSNVVTKAAATSDVWTIPRQSFATNRKTIDAKNVKRLKIQAKKKKNVSKPVRVTNSYMPDHICAFEM